MKRISRKLVSTLLQWAAVVLLVLSITSPVSSAKLDSYQTAFHLYRQAGFNDAGPNYTWTLSHVLRPSYRMPGEPEIGPVLVLDLPNASTETDPYAPGAYYGGNFYNGGSYKVGEATSPVLTTKFPFQEAIASWDAATPAGTWIETQVRAQFELGGRWTKWYNLGVWASGIDTIQRHSVGLQGDADGYVATDTLVLAKTKEAATALQLKVRLFSVNGATPQINSLSLTYSTSAPDKVTTVSQGDPALWNTLLPVPECSQMVYTDGGNVWCSPTSTSMVLGYYGFMPGPCEPRVRATVAGVYDWIYDGHGNWPFNTAFAASQGQEAYVSRYSSLVELEPWVKAGVPVVMSIAWGKNDLTGAPVASSSGHLIVLVGFDGSGNPIVNDPAASTNEDVQRTYLRSELEPLWLTNSGGTVYLIFQPGASVPSLEH